MVHELKNKWSSPKTSTLIYRSLPAYTNRRVSINRKYCQILDTADLGRNVESFRHPTEKKNVLAL